MIQYKIYSVYELNNTYFDERVRVRGVVCVCVSQCSDCVKLLKENSIFTCRFCCSIFI